jgi:AraC-like DNA-binding protein
MDKPVIPSYDLYRGDNLSLPFKLLLLDRTEGTYNASEPHRHNYYEVFYFVQGGGTHDIDFRSYPIRDHSMHFVTPGQVHHVKRNPESHGYIILFTVEFYTLGLQNRDVLTEIPFLNHGASSPVLHPTPDEHQGLLATVLNMGEEFEASRPHKEDLLRSYLSILLVQSRRLFEKMNLIPEEGRPEHELINRLRVLIERNFTTSHAPSTYAEMLCVSQNHLNSTVRKMLGRTIGDLVHERIVLEAKRLLAHTELSVKEISFQLNYDDPSYFTRFFRRHAEISPNEFRESMRKKHH